jgi:hypothetical protein
MGVSEHPSLPGEPVNIRRLDLRRPIATEIPEPEVIGIDEDDIRFSRGHTISRQTPARQSEPHTGADRSQKLTTIHLLSSFISLTNDGHKPQYLVA